MADTASASVPKKTVGQVKGMNHNIQQVMNIHHFERLRQIFHEEKQETGGFDLPKFRDVFGKVFNGTLSEEQMTMLFMKIDANSDGSVSWDEFSSYMMMGTMNSEEKTLLLVETPVPFTVPSGHSSRPHKDLIVAVEWVSRERKYISASRDGIVCWWLPSLQLNRLIDLHDFTATHSTFKFWVNHATFMDDQSRLAISGDDRRIYFFDISSLKPRLLAIIGPGNDVPTKLFYHRKFSILLTRGHLTCHLIARYDDQRDLLIWGDDGGHVNFLIFSKRFFVDHVSEDRPAVVELHHLKSREDQDKYYMKHSKRRIHADWSLQVKYMPDMNAFASCSSDPSQAVVIGEMERTNRRAIRLQSGITCFDMCLRPNFLITGGRDKLIRLWNPYVLNKPAGILQGHSSAICSLQIDQSQSQLFSASEEGCIKIWSVRTMQLLQTVQDSTLVSAPKKSDPSAILYDHTNKRFIVAQDSQLVSYESYTQSKAELVRSHNSAVISALYNASFGQVVSMDADSIVCVWNIATGERIFLFKAKPTAVMSRHSPLNALQDDATNMSFDHSRRRLLVTHRNGTATLWNFNNGQLLQRMCCTKVNVLTCGIHALERDGSKMIITAGWDRTISIFRDDSGNMSTEPLRELDGNFMGKALSHRNDITAVIYDTQSDVLASGSNDGQIVFWSMDSGHVRLCITSLMSNHAAATFERAVVALCTVEFERKMQSDGRSILRVANRSGKSYLTVLASAHADGIVRLWNTHSGTLLSEVVCRHASNEGVTAMQAAEAEMDGRVTNILLVGNSVGVVTMIDLGMTELRIKRLHQWQAHASSIMSIDFAGDLQAVLTAGKDGPVRMWTAQGRYIGTFGQDDIWNLHDPDTFAAYPRDISKDGDHLSSTRTMDHAGRLQALKRRISKSLLGIQMSLVEEVELGLRQKLKINQIPIDTLWTTVITRVVVDQWKRFVSVAREKRCQSSNLAAPVIGGVQSAFYVSNKDVQKSRACITVDSISRGMVYRVLQYYEIPQLTLPPAPSTIRNA